MLPALAWIVESTELERGLYQALQFFGVQWVQERFKCLIPGGLMTASGRELPAQLLIGADGVDSAVRQAARIAFTERDYHQMGVVTHLNCALPHDGVARQWFTGGEVAALLPMPDTAAGPQVSLVWSMQIERARALLGLPAQERASQLQQLLAGVTGGCLGELAVRGEVLGFALTLAQSGMIAPGVALVGDAAHRVHPLAGQGLNLGLGDVEQLLRVLVQKPALVSPGDETVLRRYRRARAEPVWAMRMATDGLHRLFASPLPPVALGRNLGMNLVNRLPWLKQRLIAAASNN
jgi:ubiquinone biosynthesis UbiH/UbiF/VisC/COQ6 family hydroxylase